MNADEDALPSEMALHGIHDRVDELIDSSFPRGSGARIVDIGAGFGALTDRLSRRGYTMSACDVLPDLFRAPDIECRPIGPDGALPFEDKSFDMAVAVEVIEHIDGHLRFFEETCRVLRPGGRLIFTTPNIMSLKYRLGMLMTGFGYSFGPLDPKVHDPASQHISPFGIDRYRFMLSRGGLRLERVLTDRWQKTSVAFGWLGPIIRLLARIKHGNGEGVRLQNSSTALFGRTLVFVAEKPLR